MGTSTRRIPTSLRCLRVLPASACRRPLAPAGVGGSLQPTRPGEPATGERARQAPRSLDAVDVPLALEGKGSRLGSGAGCARPRSGTRSGAQSPACRARGGPPRARTHAPGTKDRPRGGPADLAAGAEAGGGRRARPTVTSRVAPSPGEGGDPVGGWTEVGPLARRGADGDNADRNGQPGKGRPAGGDHTAIRA